MPLGRGGVHTIILRTAFNTSDTHSTNDYLAPIGYELCGIKPLNFVSGSIDTSSHHGNRWQNQGKKTPGQAGRFGKHRKKQCFLYLMANH
jgi:hypothetical protein